MTMPSAGSRPVMTSQNGCFVATPTPSGVGHFISGASVFGATGGGVAGLRGGLCVCAPADAATHASINTAMKRILQV